MLAQAAPQPAAPPADAPNIPPITRSEQQSPTQVADRLIAVFQTKSQEEWRKLIGFSKQWPELAPVVLERMLEKSRELSEPQQQLDMRKLRRQLSRVHDEIQEFNALLERFQKTPEDQWEGLVSSFRSNLKLEFFGHINVLVQAKHEDRKAQEELSTLAVKLVSLIEVVDRINADGKEMDIAAATFDDILKVGTLEEADRKIDDLAASGKLSPALLLTMAKAYSGCKDTDMTREEVKDIMAHLYFKAKESFAADLPTEVRILKHILTMDDPMDVKSALGQAFVPSDTPNVVDAGPEVQLSTTPLKMEATIEAVLQAYDAQKAKGGMMGEAAGLMTPRVIERMRQLLVTLHKEFM